MGLQEELTTGCGEISSGPLPSSEVREKSSLSVGKAIVISVQNETKMVSVKAIILLDII